MSEAPRNKSCSVCHEFKPRDAFYAHPKTLDGLQSNCKDCMSALYKARYARDPEGAKARARAKYYANIETSRAYYRERQRNLTPEQRAKRNARRRELRAQARAQ